MEKIKSYFQNNGGSMILGAALILAVIVGGVFYTTKSTGSNTLPVQNRERSSASPLKQTA
jgi:predicted negative regulator of RcsB-dependent stress response